MKKSIYPSLAIVIMLLTSSVNAETRVVTQDDKQFSDMFIKLNNNDTIKFVNLDSVKHRLVFSHKGQEEKLSEISPGNSQELMLAEPGVYDIHCMHHPEMKLTVFIPYVVNLTKKISDYEF